LSVSASPRAAFMENFAEEFLGRVLSSGPLRPDAWVRGIRIFFEAWSRLLSNRASVKAWIQDLSA
jgi:hypothetical protein